MLSSEQAIAQWRRSGVELQVGAPAERIGAVERLLGASLPEDAREFYQIVDGMRDDVYDPWLVSIWSTKRLLSEKCIQRGSDARGAYLDVAFADVMYFSWCFWFRVRANGLVSVFAESTAEELTFSAFLSRCIEDPESLDLIRAP